jgi:DNA-binding NarL/FixJ family response regulator
MPPSKSGVDSPMLTDEMVKALIQLREDPRSIVDVVGLTSLEIQAFIEQCGNFTPQDRHTLKILQYAAAQREFLLGMAPTSKSAPAAPCVLLVEDTRELALAIRRTLEARGFSVILATSRTQAHALIDREDLRFDAAILDHRLLDGDSRELVAALAARNPSCSSLVLSGYDESNVVRDYLARGAFRYATKPLSDTELVVLVSDTIHHTHRWRRALGQTNDVTPPAAIPDFDHAAERLRQIAGLSPTETIVARWMLEGLHDAEIAQRLGRAERTAKRHVSQVLAKVGVKNRAGLLTRLTTSADTS